MEDDTWTRPETTRYKDNDSHDFNNRNVTGGCRQENSTNNEGTGSYCKSCCSTGGGKKQKALFYGSLILQVIVMISLLVPILVYDSVVFILGFLYYPIKIVKAAISRRRKGTTPKKQRWIKRRKSGLMKEVRFSLFKLRWGDRSICAVEDTLDSSYLHKFLELRTGVPIEQQRIINLNGSLSLTIKLLGGGSNFKRTSSGLWICPGQELGCNSQVRTQNDIRKHWMICPFNERCQAERVRCEDGTFHCLLSQYGCEEKFETLDEIIKHHTLCSKRTIRVSCKCGKYLNNKEEEEEHFCTCPLSPFWCSNCFVGFKSLQYLNLHKRRSGCEKKKNLSSCEWCKRSFSQRNSAANHKSSCPLKGVSVPEGITTRCLEICLIEKYITIARFNRESLLLICDDSKVRFSGMFPAVPEDKYVPAYLRSRRMKELEKEIEDGMRNKSEEEKEEIMKVIENVKNSFLEKESKKLLKNAELRLSYKQDLENRLQEGSGKMTLSSSKHCAAFSLEEYDEETNPISVHDAGKPDHACSLCGALNFEYELSAERLAFLAEDDEELIHVGRSCCGGTRGKTLKLPLISFANKEHEDIFKSAVFRQNPLRLNSYFQMAVSRHKTTKDISQPLQGGIRNMVLRGNGIKRICTFTIDQVKRASFWIFSGKEGSADTLGLRKQDEESTAFKRVCNRIAALLRSCNDFVLFFKNMGEIAAEQEQGGEEDSPNQFIIDFSEMRSRQKTGNEYSNKLAEGEMRGVFKAGGEEGPEETYEQRSFTRFTMNGEPQSISEFTKEFEVLLVPLIHLKADCNSGWRMVYTDGSNYDEPGNSFYFHVSPLEYARYHSYHRVRDGKKVLNPALMAGKLSEYFFLQMAFRAIFHKLNYLIHRPMVFASRREIESGSIPKTNFFQMSHSWERGMRAKQQAFNDALSLKNRFGCPDYFITLTANPKWKEVTDSLLGGETEKERFDIIHRVFNIKMEEITKEIKGGCLGKYQAMTRVVEYQKRGLPHFHMLVWVSKEHKPRTTQVLDKTVCARIPDPETQPNLYKLVSEKCVHNRCDKVANSPCKYQSKVNGMWYCKSNFPFPFSELSAVDNSMAFSRPKRPNDGRKTSVPDSLRSKVIGGGSGSSGGGSGGGEERKEEKEILNERDNRWVIPYNIYLSCRYNSHCNVEPVASPLSIKYLFKYLFKEPERATVKVTHEKKSKEGGEEKIKSEVIDYLHGFYLGACEAFGYIIGTRMMLNNPPITRLQLHLEGGERFYFKKGKSLDEVRGDLETTRSTLVAWLNANRQVKEGLNNELTGIETLFYAQVPEYFSYNEKGNFWSMRTCSEYDPKSSIMKYKERSKYSKGGLVPSIGRIYWTSAKDKELHSLRHIIGCKKGPTSFEDLRTHEGVVYNTFFEAASAMGLLENGKILRDTMLDAIETSISARYLRYLFCVVMTEFLVPCQEVKEVYESCRNHLCYGPGMSREQRLLRGQIPDPTEEEECEALNDMFLLLKNMQKGPFSMKMLGLPEFEEVQSRCREEEIRKDYERLKKKSTYQDSRKRDEEHEMYNERYRISNDDQRKIIDRVIASVDNSDGGLFLVHGGAGVGKTHVYKTLLHWARGSRGDHFNYHDKVALSVASSGIAACLLPMGTTAHSRFKIPVRLTGSMKFCPLTLAEELFFKDVDLIIWDEVMMSNRGAIEIVDNTLRQVRNCERPFGGITTVLGGDFCQMLPVVKGQGDRRSAVISSCLFNSYLWNQVEVLSLTKIMRQTGSESAFAMWLTKVGDGEFNRKQEIGPEVVDLPKSITHSGAGTPITQEELIEMIFPLLSENHISNSMILTPTNEGQRAVNSICVSRMTSERFIFFSSDTSPKDCEGDDLLDVQIMHETYQTGLPPHRLELCIGCPVMLTRNMETTMGLCNGARLRFLGTSKSKKTLKCEFLDESLARNIFEVTGERFVWLPRLLNKCDEFEAGYTFTREQFPIQLAFSCTAHKSQGQTLDKVGIDLTNNAIFAHGQLYVSLSRVCKMEDVKVCLQKTDGKYLPVNNIVWKDVLESVSSKVKFSKIAYEEYQVIQERLFGEGYKEFSESWHTAEQERNGTHNPDPEYLESVRPRDDMSDYFPFPDNLFEENKEEKEREEEKSIKKRKVENKPMEKKKEGKEARIIDDDIFANLEDRHMFLFFNAVDSFCSEFCIQVKEVYGDGNCFYYSILENQTLRDRMQRKKPVTIQYKTNSIAHMRNLKSVIFGESLDPEIFRPLMSWGERNLGIISLEQREISLRDHIRNLNQSDVFADDVAIQLVCEVFKMNVCVIYIFYNQTSRRLKIGRQIYKPEDELVTDTIHVINIAPPLNIAAPHYNFIQNIPEETLNLLSQSLEWGDEIILKGLEEEVKKNNSTKNFKRKITTIKKAANKKK